MINFVKASFEHQGAIFRWLEEPHVKEFWDNSQEHRDDIVNYMEGRKEPSGYFGGIFDYWVGCMDGEPYALVMTSELKKDEELLPLWKQHLSKNKTLTIDFMIGNVNRLGKGLAGPTLEAFTRFIGADTYFIDPAADNEKAVRAYVKGGFCKVGTFSRHSKEHYLMVKEMFTVENASKHNEQEMLDFLKKHDEFTMFLLGNFEAHGSALTEAPNSGNFKLVRKGGDLVAVFCVARRGSLLIQSEVGESIFPTILEACRSEPIKLKGTLGEWTFCKALWDYMQKQGVIQRESFASKEILYAVNPLESDYPQEALVRLLTPDDYTAWRVLEQEYIKEMRLPNELGEEETKKQFFRRVGGRTIWGLFIEGRLVSVAELNAKAFDLAQVGGVYTSQTCRKRGYATAVMRQLIRDVKNLHKIRKLIIFTNVDNKPARKVYESLGVREAGYYALLFGS